MIALFTAILLFSLASIALVPAGLVWLWWNKRRGRPVRRPAMLLGACALALMLKFAAMPPYVHWSRNRAMDHAAAMIADIERYRARQGEYPVSLQSVWNDYDDGFAIPRYHYEPSGDSYNLYFEQPSNVFGTREFVVYNPTGTQQFTSHDSDLLRYSGAALEVRRGYYAARDASRPNWRRFLFD